MLDSLFSRYDNIIVLDTETTGLSPKTDEIIELGIVRAAAHSDKAPEEYNTLIRLSDGRTLPRQIVELTGITQRQIELEGISKAEAAEGLCSMLDCARPLVVAYNAQFDLNFIFFFLRRLGLSGRLKGIAMLDALTVYKDRRPYPHKLCDAVSAYSLQAQNTHRAVDDAKATLELLYAMERECDDLDRYINLFGYNPKYGVSGQRISSVRYIPQGYNSDAKLYNKPSSESYI